MNKLNQKAELVANFLIIVTIILIGAGAAQRYFFAKPAPAFDQAAEIAPIVGSKADLPDVNWAAQSKTLILALNKGCRYCNESAPFYKRLIESAQRNNVKLIAVFPSAVEESRTHLQNLGAGGIDVRQSPLTALRVSGTPTLILTDDTGEVTNYWIGKLPPDAEAEVINQLNSNGGK